MYKAQRIILAIVCNLLFIAFCFCYLCYSQGDMLKYVHSITSQGRSLYSPAWGAGIITGILWLFQYLLNFITKFKYKWYALSFFPAFFLLCMISNITVANGTYVVLPVSSLGGYVWVFIYAIAYSVLAVIYRKHYIVKRYKGTSLPLWIPNLLILIFGVYATGEIGNTNDIRTYEISIAQAIREGDYRKAQRIVSKSLG